MDLVRVTVISVTYNHREGLVRTLESAESQNWPALELVVVDGASNDGTRDLLEEYRSRHAYHFISEPDGGIYDAMNKGLKRARGDLVLFMNAGDTFSHDDVVRTFAQSYAAEDWEWGYGCARVLEQGQPTTVLHFVPFRFDRLALGLATVPHQAAIMTRALLWNVGGFDTDIGLAADQEVFMKAALQSPPRLWGEFFADFEGGGRGSRRRTAEFTMDMKRARQRSEIVVGGSQVTDALLTMGVLASRYALRWQAGIRRSLGLKRVRYKR